MQHRQRQYLRGCHPCSGAATASLAPGIRFRIAALAIGAGARVLAIGARARAARAVIAPLSTNPTSAFATRLASCFASATFSFVPFAPHNSLEQGEVALLQCRKLLALRAGGGFEAVDSFGDIVKLTINPPRARAGPGETPMPLRGEYQACGGSA